MTDKIEKMTDDDFKKIMQSLGMPDSMSLYAALKQVENHTWQAAQSVPVVGEPDCYDAGLLNDFGGGNVGWWQDYIRAELDRAHDFYASQWPTTSIPAQELDALRARLEQAEDVLRTLASDLGAGGYNAESVDAEVFEHKIRDGVNMLLNPLINRLEQAAELERLRKDAESYRRLISEAKKLGMQECVYPDCICPDGVSSGECNLGLPGATCRNDAIAGEKK